MAGQILHELSHRNVSMLPQRVWRVRLTRVGFEAPSWESVTAGRRPTVPRTARTVCRLGGSSQPRTQCTLTLLRQVSDRG